jgi:hypothetical protein
MTMQLSPRQIDVLRDLASIHADPNARTSRPDKWATAQDFGGSDGSHHSETAMCLAKKGLIDRIKYLRSGRSQINNFKSKTKGSCAYKINAAGLAWLKSRVL